MDKCIESSRLILNIGAGVCLLDKELIEEGKKVESLDIKNMSLTDVVIPKIFDGRNLRYKDNQFELGLLVFVLHHASDPEGLLEEAMRVSKKVLLAEDIYGSWVKRYWTYLLDSVGNLEFFGHPHSNKSDEDWKKVFAKRGYKLIEQREFAGFLGMRHKIYVLGK